MFELFLLVLHGINFGCENRVFLFPFQLQWKRRRRRKVNQLFSLDWSVFQAVTAVRNVSFIQWYNCDDIHHLMCYHQPALSTPIVITQLSFPVLLAPFYHRPTQPGIRHFIFLIAKKMKSFCYPVRICQRAQNLQCAVHADLAVCSLQKALSEAHLISSYQICLEYVCNLCWSRSLVFSQISRKICPASEPKTLLKMLKDKLTVFIRP